MALSAKAKNLLELALRSDVAAIEISDAIDAASSGSNGATGAAGADGATGAAGVTGATGPTAYSAGTPANWSGSAPTDIGSALDRISAAISAGATGPIA